MRRLTLTLMTVCGVVLGGGFAGAAQATPLFSQCPRVGSDTGCQYLITVTDLGTSIALDSSQPTYANNNVGTHESGTPTDALIGVQNNSSKPVSALNLAGDITFEFDGDGICDNASGPVPSGCESPSGATACGPVDGPCSFPPPAGEPANYTEHGAPAGMPAFSNGDVQNGYEGPTSWFSNVAPSQNSGTVNFSPSVAPGGSTYFSLEAGPVGLPSTTHLTATQRAAGLSAPVLYVPSSVPVRSATELTGGSGHPTGKVDFQLFTNHSCSGSALSAGARNAAAATLASNAIRLRRAGTYYWQAIYRGDTKNGASASQCGAQTVVVPIAGNVGLPSSRACVSQLMARLHIGKREARAGEAFVNGKLVTRFRGPQIHITVRKRETIAVIVSSVANAFARRVTTWTSFREESRTYKAC